MADFIETWYTAHQCYQVRSNDDLKLTFDLFTHRSDLVPYAFLH